jgi:hypothetical protein
MGRMLAEALSRVNVRQHTRFFGYAHENSPQSALFDSLYPPGAWRKISLGDWPVLRDTRRRLLQGRASGSTGLPCVRVL